jgi:hypothetical protein
MIGDKQSSLLLSSWLPRPMPLGLKAHLLFPLWIHYLWFVVWIMILVFTIYLLVIWPLLIKGWIFKNKCPLFLSTFKCNGNLGWGSSIEFSESTGTLLGAGIF